MLDEIFDRRSRIRDLARYLPEPLRHKDWTFYFRAALIIAGAVLACWSYHQGMLLLRTSSWETAEGVILESRVESRTNRGTIYHPIIRYRYQAEGRAFEGNRIGFYDPSNGKVLKVAPIVKRYPRGSKIPVFYDPEEPEEATLELPGARLPLGLLLAAAALVALGLVKKAALLLARLLALLFG